MTTFEITIIMLLVAIVMLLIIAFIGGVATINARMKEGFQYLGNKVEYCSAKLGYINGTAQSISQQLDNIENNILDDLRDIRIIDKCINDLAINVKGNYNTLEQQQENIGYIKMRINHILELMHPAHEVVNQPSCYAPDGICTNPQMDCINCPKRGTDGTWSTSINTNKEE
jgi:hypothetical protein